MPVGLFLIDVFWREVWNIKEGSIISLNLDISEVDYTICCMKEYSHTILSDWNEKDE